MLLEHRCHVTPSIAIQIQSNGEDRLQRSGTPSLITSSDSRMTSSDSRMTPNKASHHSELSPWLARSTETWRALNEPQGAGKPDGRLGVPAVVSRALRLLDRSALTATETPLERTQAFHYNSRSKTIQAIVRVPYALAVPP